MTHVAPLDPWQRTLELAWDGFRAGTTPIGAVIVDADGSTVAEARGRRSDEAAPAGELSGCRIAHAEVNALAHLPNSGYYMGHHLYASVEPCCLCMGAAIQTGVGVVAFAWRDDYAGATALAVRNPQQALKDVRVEGPIGGHVEWEAGLLLAAFYALDEKPRPHVVDPMRAGYPELFAYAERPDVLAALRDASAAGAGWSDVTAALPNR